MKPILSGKKPEKRDNNPIVRVQISGSFIGVINLGRNSGLTLDK